MKKCLLLCLIAAASLVSLPGCMTAKGLGQDMQTLGEKIEHKADESMRPTPRPSAGVYVAPPL